MDMDTDVARALDIIAEHAAQVDSDGSLFDFIWFNNEIDSDEMTDIATYLMAWEVSNKMTRLMYHVIRNMLKYGDWFLLRDPDTFEYYHIHPRDVHGVNINEDTLEIVSWSIKNLRFNLHKRLEGCKLSGHQDGANTVTIPAEYIVHFSLNYGRVASGMYIGGYDQGSGAAPSNGLPGQQTTGSVSSWPFGKSWLDGIQKSFKSREMLEASVIIHRIQRAPTRLAWFIDVGRTRGDKAMAALQRFRNELNQKRGQTLNQAGMDATNTVYNPISALEDYYIPVSIDQRGSKVEVLEGTPWNELPDLDYFNRKLSSGLRVPFAWLQPVQDQIIPANGRQDTATVEEVEFSRFVSRIQMMINDTLDKEFKRYLSMRGASFDPDSFIIRLNPPD
ncbi:MAG: hypothetical protein D6698_14240, partial [Gammaproteobacteria bacterium]